jgi:exodeoxyribonuclease-5
MSVAISLSDEQEAVYDAVMDNLDEKDVQTVGGYAGTGKTVLVSALSEELSTFAVCAFTGKAAHVLRRKGVAKARTIHSIIYRPETLMLKQDDGTLRTVTVFTLKEPDDLQFDDGRAVEGFLVDEASMISEPLYEDLLSFGLPCVFIGDHGQLPPVGDRDVHLMREPDYRLEVIHRNAGPIAYFAEHLRRGGACGSFPGLGGQVQVICKGALTDALLLSADQIVVGFNDRRVALNRHIRSLLGRKELLEPGDRVMCWRNARREGLFNGLQGVVTQVDLARSALSFTGDDGSLFRDVYFDRLQFGKPKYEYTRSPWHPFDYAYVVTCHKSQGSEWPHVLVQEQRCSYWDYCRWAYTAASRAQERLTWVL